MLLEASCQPVITYYFTHTCLIFDVSVLVHDLLLFFFTTNLIDKCQPLSAF